MWSGGAMPRRASCRPGVGEDAMRDFRTLRVWQKAHELTLEVSRLTRGFPKGERYGLTSQINRAAASIATNLAGGCGSITDAEFAQFVRIAARSATELDYQILLARILQLIPGPALDAFAA